MSYSQLPPTSPERRDSNSIRNRPRSQTSSDGITKAPSTHSTNDQKGGYAEFGIQMIPLVSPKSPSNIYQSYPQTPSDGLYSPNPSSTFRPRYDRANTSTTLGSIFARTRTDPTTEGLIQHRATQVAQWKIHWRTPILMVLAFVAGLLLVVGQHILYASLHKKAEEDEGKKVRLVLYGRALAYASKIAFGGCVLLCYRQRIWRTFRERPLSIWSIDQLFLATEDPSLFFNWEAFTNATLVYGMALFIWIIPLATIIISPGALTFGEIFEEDSSFIPVPTLNFAKESFKDWRVPIFDDEGTKKKSLMFYNTTDTEGKADGWFDYYDQASFDVNRISLMVAYSLKSESLNREGARLNSCGGDYNCTYTVSFIGPGYNCEELATSSDDDQKLADAGAPFNTSKLVPVGENIYFANVDMGEYKRPQADNLSSQGGVPLGPIEDDFGFFKSEPVLWIGYAIDSEEPLPEDSPFIDKWETRYDPHVFACTHYETNYTITFTYTSASFVTDISHEFVKPVVNTTFSKNEDGSLNTNDPFPEDNFISPRTDVEKYKKTAAYHAMGERLRTFLRGSVELIPPKPGPSYARVVSDLTMTRLVSNSSSTPLPGLPGLIQDFYADMVLSLFSAPQLLVVDEERVQVNRTRFKSTFIYNHGRLWGCYGPVIWITLGCLCVGAWTIFEDGTTFSVGFSRIMVTTRNLTLDEISRGACLGNDPFPPELMSMRLKFGVLNEGGHELEYRGIEGWQGAGHCAFGVQSEVTPIVKGAAYAGLDHQAVTMKRKEKVE